MQNKIKRRISTTNKGFYALNKFSSQTAYLLEIEGIPVLKLSTNIIVIGTHLKYDLHSTIKRDEAKLIIFERKVLKQIFNPIFDQMVRKNKEVQKINENPNI